MANEILKMKATLNAQVVTSPNLTVVDSLQIAASVTRLGWTNAKPNRALDGFGITSANIVSAVSINGDDLWMFAQGSGILNDHQYSNPTTYGRIYFRENSTFTNKIPPWYFKHPDYVITDPKNHEPSTIEISAYADHRFYSTIFRNIGLQNPNLEHPCFGYRGRCVFGATFYGDYYGVGTNNGVNGTLGTVIDLNPVFRFQNQTLKIIFTGTAEYFIDWSTANPTCQTHTGIKFTDMNGNRPPDKLLEDIGNTYVLDFHPSVGVRVTMPLTMVKDIGTTITNGTSGTRPMKNNAIDPLGIPSDWNYVNVRKALTDTTSNGNNPTMGFTIRRLEDD